MLGFTQDQTLKAAIHVLNKHIRNWLRNKLYENGGIQVSLETFIRELATVGDKKSAPHTAIYGRYVTEEDVIFVEEDMLELTCHFQPSLKIPAGVVTKERAIAQLAPPQIDYTFLEHEFAPGIVGCLFHPIKDRSDKELWTVNLACDKYSQAIFIQNFLWKNKLAAHSLSDRLGNEPIARLS